MSSTRTARDARRTARGALRTGAGPRGAGAADGERAPPVPGPAAEAAGRAPGAPPGVLPDYWPRPLAIAFSSVPDASSFSRAKANMPPRPLFLA
ncbi:hypothetical protein GCM10018781_73850 [Kitasatospora indigofera]|uniref:Uncharacterized protein n=1 Tax=Kitasatospora indigofera TaxID=67307 RepID=A0A919L5E7_9ACTN|nr:hypothetical protein GCM10018781_73850 [Kitasatospora indigofera]